MVRLTDRPDMTLDVYRGRKTTIQQQQQPCQFGVCLVEHDEPGPEFIKLFSCSTQLSMKFFPLINVKMPTIVGI